MRLDNDVHAAAWLGTSKLAVGGPAGLYLFDLLTGASLPPKQLQTPGNCPQQTESHPVRASRRQPRLRHTSRQQGRSAIRLPQTQPGQPRISGCSGWGRNLPARVVTVRAAHWGDRAAGGSTPYVDPVRLGRSIDAERPAGLIEQVRVVGQRGDGAADLFGDWEPVRSRRSAYCMTPSAGPQPGASRSRRPRAPAVAHRRGQGPPVVGGLGHRVCRAVPVPLGLRDRRRDDHHLAARRGDQQRRALCQRGGMRTQPVGEYGIEQAQRLLPQRGIPFLLRSGIKLLIPAPGLVDQQIQAACSALMRAAAACTARSSRTTAAGRRGSTGCLFCRGRHRSPGGCR